MDTNADNTNLVRPWAGAPEPLFLTRTLSQPASDASNLRRLRCLAVGARAPRASHVQNLRAESAPELAGSVGFEPRLQVFGRSDSCCDALGQRRLILRAPVSGLEMEFTRAVLSRAWRDLPQLQRAFSRIRPDQRFLDEAPSACSSWRCTRRGAWNCRIP